MSRVYWDTMLFVYLIEEHPEHVARVAQILTAMEKRRDSLCTSVFTLGEILTLPCKRGATEAMARIREILCPPRVELLPFTARTAELYAKIRAENRVSPADAIHLACAAEAGVDLFLTNDRRLTGLIVPGIDFIAGMGVDLFSSAGPSRPG
ncbi:MAG: PIN domain-containing protein [Bryobacteraceae bacterium]